MQVIVQKQNTKFFVKIAREILSIVNRFLYRKSLKKLFSYKTILITISFVQKGYKY